MDDLVFNPYDPAVMADPVPTYRMMRTTEPVHRNLVGGWTLFRYDDCQALLRDPRTSVEDRNARPSLRTEMLERMGESREGGQRAILNIDPPDHDRIRRIFMKAFTPRTVAALEPYVQRLVDESIEAIAANGGGDVIDDLAFVIPFAVITEMLGMPPEDAPMVRAWSHALVKTLDPVLTEEELLAAFEGGRDLRAYCLDRIAEKRANPDDGLLSLLIRAEDDGDVLDETELLDQTVLLYVAGHETTVNLIGNGTHALLGHPAEYARLGASGDLAPNATEELLRWDSPVQYSRRIILEPTEIRGQAIEPGEFVLTCVGSANHDPEKWGPTADTLDLGREGAGAHLSFGNGIHHCLGAALARLEGRVALSTLARRLPTLELAGEPVRNGRIVLRGFDALPVRVA